MNTRNKINPETVRAMLDSESYVRAQKAPAVFPASAPVANVCKALIIRPPQPDQIGADNIHFKTPPVLMGFNTLAEGHPDTRLFGITHVARYGAFSIVRDDETGREYFRGWAEALYCYTPPPPSVLTPLAGIVTGQPIKPTRRGGPLGPINPPPFYNHCKT